MDLFILIFCEWIALEAEILPRTLQYVDLGCTWRMHTPLAWFKHPPLWGGDYLLEGRRCLGEALSRREKVTRAVVGR